MSTITPPKGTHYREEKMYYHLHQWYYPVEGVGGIDDLEVEILELKDRVKDLEREVKDLEREVNELERESQDNYNWGVE